MERRNLLVLLGAAATSTAHEWLIARAAHDTGCSTGGPVPPGVVDHLDEIADHLRRMDDQLGGGSLLSLARQQARAVVGLLDGRRYTESVGKRLHSTLAELLRLAGWLSFDSSRHAAAQRYWAAGLHAAHAAGDRALGANILGFLSCQAKDLGHVRDAITLAETALAGYPGATPRVAAILELRAAEAHANDDDLAACRPRIDAAFERLRENAASTGEPGWCYWLDETHAHGQAGYSYLRLRDWVHARSHLQTATRIQAPAYAREAALRHVLLARTYLYQDHPDVEEAVRLGNLAIDALDGEVDSTRCVGHVYRLSTALTPHASHPAVHELRERAHLLRASAAAMT
jgi:tetratricopeptide (TPR) repeat protein